jgi:hypothetical protein
MSRLSPDSVQDTFPATAGRVGVRIADYVVYAEMYHWLLNELHDKGSLPADWREKTKAMMEAAFGKDTTD